MNEAAKGEGWLLFAGIMILVAGVLNVIWGIAAIDSANFFIEDDRYIFEDLNTMGWCVLVIGVVQLFAAFSIWSGGQFGRWIGIIAASAGGVETLRAGLVQLLAYLRKPRRGSWHFSQRRERAASTRGTRRSDRTR